MRYVLIALGSGLLLVLAVLLLGRPLLQALLRRQAGLARALFHRQREQLEAKFVELASLGGKPRGVRWVNVDWSPDATFGRDIRSGMLTAFVGITVHFEAVEGGDMEDVEHVGLARDASALFHFDGGRWGTGGRALFNMNPTDAIGLLRDQYDPV